MRKYFIYNGQEKRGPFNFEELNGLEIKKDTPIWYEGLENWTIASNVDELKLILKNSMQQPPKFENSSVELPPFISQNKPQNKIFKYILIGLVILSLLSISLFIFSLNSTDGLDDDSTEEFPAAAPVAENTTIIELSKKNRSYRNSIEKYVFANTNKYTYNELGGISNLDITVFNNTEYVLDEASVAVDYIKDSGEIFKTEIITFYNIPPNNDKTMSAPESNRGTSVEAKIQTISSKELNMCYDNTFAPKVGDIDPYFCK